MQLHKNICIDKLSSDFKQMHPFADGLKSQITTLAPVAYAATGNDGLAAASLALQPSRLPGKAKGWFIEIWSGSSRYEGWVTGIFFKEGQNVDLICKGERTIYAVYSAEQERIALRPGILNAWQPEYANCLKVYKWITLFFLFILTLILVIINISSDAPFSAYLTELPFIVIGVPLFSAVLIWASSRKELKSAAQGTRIFRLLKFSDPKSLVLATGARLVKMEEGTDYFFKTEGLTCLK